MLNKPASQSPDFYWSVIARISLVLAGLMWVLPFLYYHHAYPLTTFYQEWGAAILGLAASVFLLSKAQWQKPEIPQIVLLPIGLLMLALVQYLLGKIIYFDQMMLFALYMLWATLLVMLGRALREEFGLAVLVTVLASFLLLGSELNALAGILQHYRWHTFLDKVVTAQPGVAVYGNVAQPNHYADYITLGLISLGLLRMHLRTWQAVLLALPLLFVLVLSGSRSSWLYLLGIAVMAFVWQRKDRSCKPLLRYTLVLLLGFGLMHWLVHLPWLNGAEGNVTTMQRMMSGETSGSIRLYLWHEAWLIFAQFPFMGAGLGQYAWQHFQLAPGLQGIYVTGLYNNAHNLVMQIAAEMGLAGLFILFVTVGMWLWQLWGAKLTRYHWWGYAVLFVLGTHSMLEYPLWYAYFIGIAATLLGVFDQRTYRLELGALGRLSIVAVLLLGLVSLLQVQFGYGILEKSIAERPKSATDTAYALRMREGLIAVHGISLLQPYAELYMDSYVDISSDELDRKLAFNDRVIKFVPISSGVYRRAGLLALANRQEEANVQLERAIWAYPGDYRLREKELSALAQKDPEHFSALLKFGIEKNKEYINAVPAK